MICSLNGWKRLWAPLARGRTVKEEREREGRWVSTDKRGRPPCRRWWSHGRAESMEMLSDQIAHWAHKEPERMAGRSKCSQWFMGGHSRPVGGLDATIPPSSGRLLASPSTACSSQTAASSMHLLLSLCPRRREIGSAIYMEMTCLATRGDHSQTTREE